MLLHACTAILLELLMFSLRAIVGSVGTNWTLRVADVCVLVGFSAI